MTPGQREVPAPTEPPDGSVYYGSAGDVWQRNDVPEDDTSCWWLDGEVYSFDMALTLGLDLARRLVVVDPTDEAQVERLGQRLAIELHLTPTYAPDVARAALRAVAGQQP